MRRDDKERWDDKERVTTNNKGQEP